MLYLLLLLSYYGVLCSCCSLYFHTLFSISRMLHNINENEVYRTESDAAEEHLSIRLDLENEETNLKFYFPCFQSDWVEMGGGEKPLCSDQLCFDFWSGQAWIPSRTLLVIQSSRVLPADNIRCCVRSSSLCILWGWVFFKPVLFWWISACLPKVHSRYVLPLSASSHHPGSCVLLA